MKLPVRDVEGKELRTLEVDDTVFGIVPNTGVLHQAFVAQRNNQRWGTAQTKTRGLVQGSTRKIRMQKYTGRARQGSARAPNHVGGGTVFGPVQRSYARALPKKMRRLAIRSALSGKVADGQLVVVDELTFEKPKTKEILRVLHNVGIERSALIVTGGPDRTVLASVRNLDKTKVLPAAYLNVGDMMNHAGLLMTEEAVRVAEQLWGRKAAIAAAPAPEAKPEAKAAPRRRARAKGEAPAKPEAAPVAKAPVKARAAVTPKAAAKAKEPAAEPPAAKEAPAKPRARRAVAKEAPVAEAALVAEDTPKRPVRRKATETTVDEKPPAGAKPRVRRAKKTEEGKA